MRRAFGFVIVLGFTAWACASSYVLEEQPDAGADASVDQAAPDVVTTTPTADASEDAASDAGSDSGADADADATTEAGCVHPCDCDGDGYNRSACPEATAPPYDCDDNDPVAHPDAGFQSLPAVAPLYGDWNCDGVVETELPNNLRCPVGLTCGAGQGFLTSVPCGGSGDLAVCPSGVANGTCTPTVSGTNAVQFCK